MQLLTADASPFARKVRVLIREANLLDAVEEVPVMTGPTAPDPTVVAANPLGKIPTLLRSDGPAIYDSRVITRFLNDHAATGFYPANRLWDVLTLEATADAMMEASVLRVYEGRVRPEGMRSEDWLEAQKGKADRALSVIEARWMSLMEGPLHMGQIAVGCALGYLDLRFPDEDWRGSNPTLAAWAASFAEREAMDATQPS
ncbi:glutathione S-transferase [Aestuariibius sp. 2305UL40-4]|uniref:glutathione S-transferase n=1 Tax=Aestuariibius violaceus TaxID=3234132 RepID=UPI00345EA5A9